MANGRAFKDAVEQARSVPKLDVGCHVVLVDGTPVGRPEQVRCLLAPAKQPARPLRRGAVRSVSATMSPENKFYDGFGQIAVRGLRGALRQDQIEAETIAQIRKLQ